MTSPSRNCYNILWILQSRQMPPQSGLKSIKSRCNPEQSWYRIGRNKAGNMVNKLSLKAFLTGLLLVFPLVLGAQNAIPVKTARLKDVAIYLWKSAPATVVSLNNTSLSTQIKARIEEISVKVGEIVDAGSMVVRLDCTDYRIAEQQVEANIAALEARIRLAERRLARTRKLERQQTASEELLDQREADLDVLQAEHRGALSEREKAKINVSRCTIRSPYRAVITSRVGAVGEFADVGTKLLEIMDIEKLEISAQVPSRDIEPVEQAEEIYFEDTAKRYAVKLRTVTPAVNTQTRNREVRLLFSNGPALPGAAGKLIWRDKQPHISAKLLVRRGNHFGIFTNANGKARFHIIPEAQQGRTTPVGLPLDTVVVTEGHYRLENGQPVILYNPR